ncbi:MAG: MBL fold metallo-hydrolase, partial [Actinomycetota bacterium]
MMKVTLLGTGSPIPDPNRAGPSTLVQAAGQHIVVDCGRGCVMRLTGAGVFPPFLSAVLLTHLHSDHISDLNDIVTSRWIMSPQPRADLARADRAVEVRAEGLRRHVPAGCDVVVQVGDV